MDMGAEGVTKACAFCGLDVSNKPRSKDAQGRYICAECLNKAAAAKARADAVAKGIDLKKAATPPKQLEVNATTDGTDAVLSSLIAASPAQKGTPCPQCGRLIPPEGVICIGCGFHRETGKVLRTRIEKPPKDAKPSGKKPEKR